MVDRLWRPVFLERLIDPPLCLRGQLGTRHPHLDRVKRVNLSLDRRQPRMNIRSHCRRCPVTPLPMLAGRATHQAGNPAGSTPTSRPAPTDTGYVNSRLPAADRPFWVCLSVSQTLSFLSRYLKRQMCIYFLSIPPPDRCQQGGVRGSAIRRPATSARIIGPQRAEGEPAGRD